MSHPRLVDFEKRISGASLRGNRRGRRRHPVERRRRPQIDASRSYHRESSATLARHGGAQAPRRLRQNPDTDSTWNQNCKSLDAIRAASGHWPGTVVPTLLGAHVVPHEFRKNLHKYVELDLQRDDSSSGKAEAGASSWMYFAIVERLAPRTPNKSSPQHSSMVSMCVPTGPVERNRLDSLLRFNPASFDHMDHVNDGDFPALAKSDTVATLVPGANYFLGLDQYPNARQFIESGVAVALATDYNPGSSPTLSMPMAMSLACTHMKMLPAEAITAATINGAWALRFADRKGTLSRAKTPILRCSTSHDYREIPYWFGTNRCALTIMNGEPSDSAVLKNLKRSARGMSWREIAVATIHTGKLCSVHFERAPNIVIIRKFRTFAAHRLFCFAASRSMKAIPTPLLPAIAEQ